MKKYIWGRIIRAIVSIFIVTTVAMIMIYTLIPRELIFKEDAVYQKLGGKEDDRANYRYTAYERLGYVDFVEQQDMCKAYAEDNLDACVQADSTQIEDILPIYEKMGYTVEQYKKGTYYAYKDSSILKIVGNFYKNLIHFDSVNYVQDADNPDIERKIYFGTDYNGLPAIKCSGCEYKYQVYLDNKWPFVHQHFMSLNLGQSYPSYAYEEIGKVITDRQGQDKNEEMTFETGKVAKSATLQHTCRYKNASSMDSLDKTKFYDNYADCDTLKSDPSMIQNSMTFGIIALIIAYAIAIPAGMGMASHKGKFGDKLGTVYINFMIAVPSLAFIFFARQIGIALGLPMSFPILGAHDIRSYISPIIILALMNTSSLMLWTRRYMIDQANADYVKFARSKGLSQQEIFRKHIMRNAIIPIAQGIPSNIVMTISGAVLTETVFAIPGTGKLLPDAISDHNNSMIVALTLIYTALSIFSVLAGDLLMTVLDPRIHLEESESGN